MKLYLVQHGDALSKDVDPDRPLSETGHAEMERLAVFFDGGDVQVSRVIHSGKTRARETAELLAAKIGPENTIEAVEGLNPMDPIAPFVDRVSVWEVDTLVVGHLPFMARLVSRLVTGADEPAIAAFRPGSMVCLERTGEDEWAVAWMIRPELLG